MRVPKVLNTEAAWRFIAKVYLQRAAGEVVAPRLQSQMYGLCGVTSGMVGLGLITSEQEKTMDRDTHAIMRDHDRHGWLVNFNDTFEPGHQPFTTSDVLRGTLALIFAEAQYGPPLTTPGEDE